MPRPALGRIDLAAIGAGGVVGAALRALISRDPSRADEHWVGVDSSAFGSPGRTLAANLIGCLLLGGLSRLTLESSARSRRRTILAASSGFCGSLTTFSTFAVEVASHLQDDTTAVEGVIYALSSVSAAGLAFWFGRALAHQVLRP